MLESWSTGSCSPMGESIQSFHCSNTPGFVREVSFLPNSQQLYLEPYSPNAVKKRKDISDGVMESWSVESSVWSPNPITPVFQYSLTPTFGSGYAGLGLIVGGFPAWASTHC
jgi:hypothetical protein